MKLFVGTSGYSYKEWKGSFYPADLPDKHMLRYYAERFRTVEINNTFYRMPTESMLTNWLKEVPAGFSFVLKAPQRITHHQKLKDVDDSVAYFVRVSAVLGDRRGPLLFQLPPFFRKDAATLKAFLSRIPSHYRAALEFRHASWFDEEIFEILRAENASFCIAEAEGNLQVPFVPTADWGYLRLRRPDYGDAELQEWVTRVLAQKWKDAYVFFKHEDEGLGPKFASRFMELAGQERQ